MEALDIIDAAGARLPVYIVDQLVIAAEARRRGVATRLLEQVLQAGQSAGLATTVWSIVDTRPVYRSCGFVVCETPRAPADGGASDTVYMVHRPPGVDGHREGVSARTALAQRADLSPDFMHDAKGRQLGVPRGPLRVAACHDRTHDLGTLGIPKSF